MNEIKRRIAPFVALLDARYLPLLFAVAPQAYAVYAWLLVGGAPQEVAVLGGVGFEMVYVGAIAWAEDGRSSGWTWLTAVASLVFSVAVAVYHYRGAGMGAWLHAGFPIVAFCYTLQMHAASRVKPAPQTTPQEAPQPAASTAGAPQEQPQVAPQGAAPVWSILRDDDPLRDEKLRVWEGRTASPPESWEELAGVVGKSKSTIRDWYNNMRARLPQEAA